MKTIEQIALNSGALIRNGELCFTPQDLADFISAVDAERGEPVAWSYTSKITGAETLTHQPPDRVIEHEQFVIHPLYLAPQPTSADMEDAGRYRWAVEKLTKDRDEYKSGFEAAASKYRNLKLQMQEIINVC